MAKKEHITPLINPSEPFCQTLQHIAQPSPAVGSRKQGVLPSPNRVLHLPTGLSGARTGNFLKERLFPNSWALPRKDTQLQDGVMCLAGDGMLAKHGCLFLSYGIIVAVVWSICRMVKDEVPFHGGQEGKAEVWVFFKKLHSY